MNYRDHLPPEDRAASQHSSDTADAKPEEGTLQVVVSEKKALLREVKGHNQAGRPVMRIYEPRQRYNSGEVLTVDPQEILADGGVLYYRCSDQPDLYVRKADVSPL